MKRKRNAMRARVLILLAGLAILAAGCSSEKDEEGVVKLPSGVKYVDLVVGTGPEALTGKVIDCYYTGWLKNSKQPFDSNIGKKPFSIRLGKGEVIRGWEEGIPGMKQGGKRRLEIPPDLAYGAVGRPPSILPYSTLIFEVEVLKVK
jgi:peptidylprolyl isomerase/FKBP-type peptidyl-prolyl cis-trans isomerase FkpA